MKVRIKLTPAQREIDGIDLKRFTPGSIREVSSTTAAWLIAEGYAEPEMRSASREEDQFYAVRDDKPSIANDRRQRGR